MITVIDNIAQGTKEWFALRVGSLGASKAKDAIAGGQGKSRKTLAFQLASELITGEKTIIKQTEAMRIGVERESEARQLFEFQKDISVKEVALILNDKFNHCHCSPDGILDGCGLEIKCPNAATHVRYLYDGKCPAEYKAQLQFSMMITEMPMWYFMSY